MDRKKFYSLVRKEMPRGKLTSVQVETMNAIFDEVDDMQLSHVAYILATIHHETGGTFEACREGFHNKPKTHANALKAVAWLYRHKKISTNYALPHKNGNCYYGRGLVQITWYDNYKKLSKHVGVDLVRYPDRALDLDIAVRITVVGMVKGLFRKGKSLSKMLPEAPTTTQWKRARDIINGDIKKNGPVIGRKAVRFLLALEASQTVHDEVEKPKVVKKTIKKKKKESLLGSIRHWFRRR